MASLADSELLKQIETLELENARLRVQSEITELEQQLNEFDLHATNVTGTEGGQRMPCSSTPYVEHARTSRSTLDLHSTPKRQLTSSVRRHNRQNHAMVKAGE